MKRRRAGVAARRGAGGGAYFAHALMCRTISLSNRYYIAFSKWQFTTRVVSGYISRHRIWIFCSRSGPSSRPRCRKLLWCFRKTNRVMSIYEMFKMLKNILGAIDLIANVIRPVSPEVLHRTETMSYFYWIGTTLF